MLDTTPFPVDPGHIAPGDTPPPAVLAAIRAYREARDALLTQRAAYRWAHKACTLARALGLDTSARPEERGLYKDIIHDQLRLAGKCDAAREAMRAARDQVVRARKWSGRTTQHD